MTDENQKRRPLFEAVAQSIKADAFGFSKSDRLTPLSPMAARISALIDFNDQIRSGGLEQYAENGWHIAQAEIALRSIFTELSFGDDGAIGVHARIAFEAAMQTLRLLNIGYQESPYPSDVNDFETRSKRLKLSSDQWMLIRISDLFDLIEKRLAAGWPIANAGGIAGNAYAMVIDLRDNGIAINRARIVSFRPDSVGVDPMGEMRGIVGVPFSCLRPIYDEQKSS